MAEAIGVVLAAGKGTRMKSELPKVLLEVGGRPMVSYVVEALRRGGIGRIIVVVGYRGELVQAALANQPGVEFTQQTEQLGTGHAVMMCRPLLEGHAGPVMVVAGDSPMIQAETVSILLEEFRRLRPACVLGTVRASEPRGLGRIIRDAAGNFRGIVEEKDATAQQRQITEVNMSYYVFDCRELLGTLGQLRADNSQREYYITDVPGILISHGKSVHALCVLKPWEALSVNTAEELAAVEVALKEHCL
jgi:bifunctional UDP-N-acetylglucosamine pyrophosphorylase/glucosamine-1-phosphate N-acetyltransferase/UDP-N-acetylglucosamine pyrophosphorylase